MHAFAFASIKKRTPSHIPNTDTGLKASQENHGKLAETDR
jgi:hypothetical protein